MRVTNLFLNRLSEDSAISSCLQTTVQAILWLSVFSLVPLSEWSQFCCPPGACSRPGQMRRPHRQPPLGWIAEEDPVVIHDAWQCALADDSRVQERPALTMR